MSPKKSYPIQQKKVASADGTTIGYQVMGSGNKTIVLCNGLGGSALAWSPIYNHFGDSYKFVTWDYRGLFKSDPPADMKRMTMEDHMKDMEAVLEKEGIKKALIGGWSMGVQIALEYYRTHPKEFAALFLLNGTSGYPFDTALNNPLSRYILPSINDLAQKLIPFLQPTIRPLAARVIDWKGFAKLVSRIGLVHENLNSEIFQQVASEMIQTDLTMYHTIMDHLSRHDASDVLSKIKVPTLIIAGDQDIITPLKVAEKMADLCPKSQLFIIPGGTHYSILEFPDSINLRMEQFLKEAYPA